MLFFAQAENCGGRSANGWIERDGDVGAGLLGGEMFERERFRAGQPFEEILEISAHLGEEEGITSGLTLPQSDFANVALNVLSMFIGLPPPVRVTVVWLVPLKC